MKSMLLSSFILLFSFITKNKLQFKTTAGLPGMTYNSNVTQNQVNQISNRSELQPLKNKIRKTDSSLTLIKVLHIGDSHVKSGFFSEHFMEKLNSFYAQKFHGNLFFNFQVFCKIGTKYADYDELAELDNQLIRERPDLVIISLGTNDAFSGSSRVKFAEKIDHLVQKVKTLSPQSSILLTTPSDALRMNAVAGMYMELPELQYVVNEIIKYANDHGLAYWNLYQVMGGPYSVNTWFQKKMAAPDRVHFTGKGYTMFADWLFDAFTVCMETNDMPVLPFNIHY